MPLICICGKWLEQAGFITGDEVSVKDTRYGELVISLLPERK
ncbi:MAG: type I toxin-antitoxin system SymE family toxin [Ruminiclostridium sp.]|nr:type I toxin-antitoxin system SymE family toxin [Ruminiclostridium sp.]